MQLAKRTHAALVAMSQRVAVRPGQRVCILSTLLMLDTCGAENNGVKPCCCHVMDQPYGCSSESETWDGSETSGWKFRSRIPPHQPAGALKLVDAVRPNQPAVDIIRNADVQNRYLRSLSL